jgi:NAD-dependent dihydropyrimidine dehydrogenase PreA subunit
MKGFAAAIDQNKCDGALSCMAMRSCPQGAIFEVEREAGPRGLRANYAIGDGCTGCGICTQFCPHDAISVN